MKSEKKLFDIVVVGGGGAGLAAAIEAASLGVRVVLLEKNNHLGGSTAWSIGSISSTLTPHQKKKKIIDSPQHHWEDMPGFAGDLGDRDNDELRKILCDEIPNTFQWLLDSGVRFLGPMPEPPHRQPRMHNVLPNSRSFIYHLERRAKKAGVVIKFNSNVTKLIQDKNEVAGVIVRTKNGEEIYAAKGGVILASGDFTNSEVLKARFMGLQAAKVEAVNSSSTGDGHVMAEILGGQILNGDLALGPELRFIAPVKETLMRRLPPWAWFSTLIEWSIELLPDFMLRPFLMKFLTTALAPSISLFEYGAILVNQDGLRFGDEKKQPALRVPDQPGKVRYIILDRDLAEKFNFWPHFISTAPGIAYAYTNDYKVNRPDVYTQANSIKELSIKLKMNLQNLEKSLNQSTEISLSKGPFVALGPVRSVFVHNEGGLKVDSNHRVLDSMNKPISGLYAAGSTGQGGLLLKGHGHHLAWAFVSGRRSGRIAAHRALIS